MRLFRRDRVTKTSAARSPSVTPLEDAEVVSEVVKRVPSAVPSYDQLEDSDVFLNPGKPASMPPGPSTGDATSGFPGPSTEVTLFVYGWHNVEPGPLSWVFPSLRAALDSVQRMKNAIGWCIVQGSDWDDLELARDHGAVLIEQR